MRFSESTEWLRLRRYQVEREIRLQAPLAHPHIIALHAAFEDEDNVYMAQVLVMDIQTECA